MRNRDSSFGSLIVFSLTVTLLLLHIRAQAADPAERELIVTIQPISETDLGYDLMHLEIVADGHLPGASHDFGYRVVSVREQGNCVDICPRTPVYVVIGSLSGKRDEKLTLYRIDGVHFMHFPKTTTLDPEENNGFFLSLRFTSMPHPQVIQHFVARFGPQGAVVERDGPDVPPPAHRFANLLQRPGAGVFRIKLKDGNVFRLRNFETFDPKVYGQADGWVGVVVESGAANLPSYRMASDTNFGPFVESDITEIFDEDAKEIVFPRDQ